MKRPALQMSLMLLAVFMVLPAWAGSGVDSMRRESSVGGLGIVFQRGDNTGHDNRLGAYRTIAPRGAKTLQKGEISEDNGTIPRQVSKTDGGTLDNTAKASKSEEQALSKDKDELRSQAKRADKRIVEVSSAKVSKAEEQELSTDKVSLSQRAKKTDERVVAVNSEKASETGAQELKKEKNVNSFFGFGDKSKSRRQGRMFR